MTVSRQWMTLDVAVGETPEQGRIRRAVRSGACPWCTAGPFGSIASHTWQAHGVSAAELRERAGLPRSASLTSDDTAERYRGSGRERYAEGKIGPGAPGWKKGAPRGPQRPASLLGGRNRTECVNGHPLPFDAPRDKRGRRRCMECQRGHALRYYRANKETA